MTEKQMHGMSGGRRVVGYAAAALVVVGGWATAAQAQQKYPVPGANFPTAPQLQLPDLPTPKPITPNGLVVEDVIARVADGIITRSEYDRAQQGLLQGAQQAHASQADLDDQQKNLLRDMIDQQLLLSKAKELGINGDAETLRQLDEIRKQNHLDSMDALKDAAEQQGVSFEDFKRNIHDRIVTSQVVRDEVGRHISLSHVQEDAYFSAHKQEFVQPEQIHLSEILIPTPDGATDAQVAAAQKKADDAAAKLKAGTGFADLAKTVSGGPTASAGGDLGDFKRGALGQVLEDATFSLPVGGVTAPIRTKQGFVILKVDSHNQGGVPPMKDVEQQVQEAIYNEQMQPALRAYLTRARNDAYIEIEHGFVDTGSDAKETKPTFAAYVPPAPKKKIIEKQRMEQEKAIQAQTALAAAREKERQKQEEKLTAQQKKSGVQTVASPTKVPKIKKEKIRYGQAPRNSLPTAKSVAVTEEGAPLSGQAPGVAMASNDASSTVGGDEDPLAPKVESDHKGRFSDRERQYEEEHAKVKVKHTATKAEARPLQATTTEKADESQQSSALGLNGDTAKKQKVTRVPGEAKPRLQDKPSTAPAPAPEPAPTVNPALTSSSPIKQETTTQPAKASDQPMVPPSYQGAPGASPAGQPIPATTSTEENAPATTPAPH